MPPDESNLSLDDLRAACQSIVTRLADYVRRGGNVELGYLMYRNQLRGFFLFTAGTAGESVVRHAENALDAEYRRLKASGRTSNR